MLNPASGIGIYTPGKKLAIRLLRQGCTNRPFFHIVVAESRFDKHDPVVEQLGSYDPLPNEHNEKLVALNYERLRYWIGNGAETTTPVEQLLGLAGFYPIHPTSYMTAWRNRQMLAKKEQAEQEAKAKEEEKVKESVSSEEKVE